jgi:hypothetical protein
MELKFPKGGRLQENGDLVFPQRGTPPKYPIQGFKKDPTDPWRYKAVFAPCVHRRLDEKFYQQCGCTGVTTHCLFYKKNINLSQCLTCEATKT